MIACLLFASVKTAPAQRLTPEECKERCRVCACQWDGAEWVCVCIEPRLGAKREAKK